MKRTEHVGIRLNAEELRRLHRLSRQLHIERLVDVLREGLIALEAREEDRLAVAEAGSRRAYERPAQALGAPPAKHRSVLREGLIAPEAREDRLAGAEAESRRAHERPAAALGAPPSKPRSPT